MINENSCLKILDTQFHCLIFWLLSAFGIVFDTLQLYLLFFSHFTQIIYEDLRFYFLIFLQRGWVLGRLGCLFLILWHGQQLPIFYYCVSLL